MRAAIIAAATLALAGCGAVAGKAPPLTASDVAPAPFVAPKKPPPCRAWSAKELADLFADLGPLAPTDVRVGVVEEWLALRKDEGCPEG